jgi:hypothetical protein
MVWWDFLCQSFSNLALNSETAVLSYSYINKANPSFTQGRYGLLSFLAFQNLKECVHVGRVLLVIEQIKNSHQRAPVNTVVNKDK